VSAAASVGDRERLRLFCALRVPDDTLEELSVWQTDAFGQVDGVRVLGREHLHVTLAFLGNRPADELDAIAAELRAAALAAKPSTLTVKGYRETRSVGMLVLEDEDGRAASLAVDLHERLERLGVYERERRPWLPHLTVIRFRRRPKLQPPLPQAAQFTPSDAAVYMSTLRPSGAQYSVLESVGVGR
jgi:2'-5' RNA ligase